MTFLPATQQFIFEIPAGIRTQDSESREPKPSVWDYLISTVSFSSGNLVLKIKLMTDHPFPR